MEPAGAAWQTGVKGWRLDVAQPIRGPAHVHAESRREGKLLELGHGLYNFRGEDAFCIEHDFRQRDVPLGEPQASSAVCGRWDCGLVESGVVEATVAGGANLQRVQRMPEYGRWQICRAGSTTRRCERDTGRNDVQHMWPRADTRVQPVERCSIIHALREYLMYVLSEQPDIRRDTDIRRAILREVVGLQVILRDRIVL